MQVAASSYYARKNRAESARSIADRKWDTRIVETHEANRGLYGARKMWKVLGAMYPEDRVARCTVERRMAALGLSGVGNSRTTRTTRPAPQGASHPGDKLERNFTASAPNMKWVADITYVPTWSGFVYVAFIMDLFSRAIVGWSVDTTLRADLALNALEHAMLERGRRKHEVRGVIHHSDKGAQYTSITYTSRLVEAEIEASVGSTGDSYDNAAAEALMKLFKKEVVWRDGPWSGRDSVEYAVMEWVHWYNNSRIHSRCSDMAPMAFEALHYTRSRRPGEARVLEPAL